MSKILETDIFELYEGKQQGEEKSDFRDYDKVIEDLKIITTYIEALNDNKQQERKQGSLRFYIRIKKAEDFFAEYLKSRDDIDERLVKEYEKLKLTTYKPVDNSKI